MNYIKWAEEYLYNYRALKRSIPTMEKEIARLISKTAPRDIQGISYDKVKVQTSLCQDDTYNLLFQIQQYKESIETTKALLEDVKEVLKEISEDVGCEVYGELLWMSYVEGKTAFQIAAILGFNEKYIYELRKKAIKKFAINILGIKAL